MVGPSYRRHDGSLPATLVKGKRTNSLPGAKGRAFQLVGSLLDFDPQEARPENIKDVRPLGEYVDSSLSMYRGKIRQDPPRVLTRPCPC